MYLFTATLCNAIKDRGSQLFYCNLVTPVTDSVILQYLFPDNIVKVTKFHFSPRGEVYCGIRRRRHTDTVSPSDFYAQFPLNLKASSTVLQFNCSQNLFEKIISFQGKLLHCTVETRLQDHFAEHELLQQSELVYFPFKIISSSLSILTKVRELYSETEAYIPCNCY